MTGEVEHLVGEAPLVIVPGDELDEVIVQSDAGLASKMEVWEPAQKAWFRYANVNKNYGVTQIPGLRPT